MKRQRIEIMAQILAFCIHATRKTRIMYKNNLNHAQLKDYLTLLTSRHLLERNSDTYMTTEKGQRFLEAFAQLKDVLEDHASRSLVEICRSYEVRTVLETFPMSEIGARRNNNDFEKH